MGLYYSSALLASVSASSVSAAAAPSASATPSNGWSAGTCLTDDGARLLTGPCEFDRDEDKDVSCDALTSISSLQRAEQQPLPRTR